MNSKKYLVTGGSGFIGSALVKRLVETGHPVVVLDNNSRGSAARLQGVDCKFVQADIRDREAVFEASRGVDSVCHLAYVNGTEFFYSRPDVVLDVGVKGIVNVIDACRENQVPELVLASSSEVYQEPPHTPTSEDVPLVIPDPYNPRYSYAAGKIISEVMALHLGDAIPRILIFRPHNVYGPDMGWEHVVPQFTIKLHEHLRDGLAKIPIQGDGSQTRAFVYIDDFIRGLELVLQKGEHRGIYHIGTEEEVTIASLASLMAESLNIEVELEPGECAPGATPRRCPDISRLKGLGFSPQVPLKDGVARTVGWYWERVDQHADRQVIERGVI